jgi:hypothetical protein
MMPLGNMRATLGFGKLALACLSVLLATSRLATTEPTLLSFACNGKKMEGKNEEAVRNIGLTINLAEKVLSFAKFTAVLDNIDTASIHFFGNSRNKFGVMELVSGTIDRVTGSLEVAVIFRPPGTKLSSAHTISWSMVCKPMTPLF